MMARRCLFLILISAVCITLFFSCDSRTPSIQPCRKQVLGVASHLQKVTVSDAELSKNMDMVASYSCFNNNDYYLISKVKTDKSYDISIEEFVYDSISAEYVTLYSTIKGKHFFVSGDTVGLFAAIDTDSSFSMPFNSLDDYCYPHGDYRFLVSGQVSGSSDIISADCSE